jgi:hypothetical protein
MYKFMYVYMYIFTCYAYCKDNVFGRGVDKVLKAVRCGEAADGRDDGAQCEERVRYVKIPVFKPESILCLQFTIFK